MMHQRVSEKTSGEWEGCVIWREGLLQRLRVCVRVSIFFCLFVSDGRCLMVIESIFIWNHHKFPSSFFLLNMLSGSFNVEPGSTSFLQRIERHDIADRHQNKWLFQTASICLYCTFSVSWFGYAVSHPKSTMVLLQVIADTLCLRAAFAAKADDHWSKSLHYLADEQYYAIASYLGRTKWTWMDMHENGGIWIQAIIGLCKEQPLGYVGVSCIHVWGHGFPSSFNSLVVSYAARGRRQIERPHHLKMMRVMFLAFRKKPFKIYVGLVSWCGVYVSLQNFLYYC